MAPASCTTDPISTHLDAFSVACNHQILKSVRNRQSRVAPAVNSNWILTAKSRINLLEMRLADRLFKGNIPARQLDIMTFNCGAVTRPVMEHNFKDAILSVQKLLAALFCNTSTFYDFSQKHNK